MLLVESPYVGDHKSRGEHCLLNGVPYGVARVVEDDGDPASGLENPAVLGEAALHQVLIVGDCLSLGAIDYGLGFGAREDSVPRLDEIVEVGVIDVLAEGWVGEYVVNGVVGQGDAAAIDG